MHVNRVKMYCVLNSYSKYNATFKSPGYFSPLCNSIFKVVMYALSYSNTYYMVESGFRFIPFYNFEIGELAQQGIQPVWTSNQ